MKLFTTEQIREADQYTIKNEPIASIDLMERAATLAFKQIQNNYNTTSTFAIVVGSGNQGGDGLVIARLLHQKGYSVDVFDTLLFKTYSPDFLINRERLKQECGIKIKAFESFTDQYDVIIDAILGTGINRIITGGLSKIVNTINQCKSERIAIDIPSGLFSEDNQLNLEQEYASVIKADYTLSFHCPKIAFLFPEHEAFVGHFEVFDIGIHPDFINQTASPFYFTEAKDIQKIWKKRAIFAHKGTMGHSLLHCGSEEKMGAAILSAKAALRSGLGLLSCLVPSAQIPIINTTIPEAMCIKKNISSLKNIQTKLYKSIGIGCGLGCEVTTVEEVSILIKKAKAIKQALLIDADGINILASHKELQKDLPPNSILTPHLKELERLTGKSYSSHYERMQETAEWASQHQVYVLIKGAYSIIVTPQKEFFFNSTGNPGMATAGSGDVLTGIILGLLSQGYTPFEALRIGVYIHGLAADKACENLGQTSLIASDIINYLPKAFQMFENQE